MKLRDENFYLIVNYCEGLDEIKLIISYSICRSCDIIKLINSTNRFYELEEDWFLPVIFDIDLKYSSMFASADGNVRIKSTRSEHPIELLPNLKKSGTYIINYRD